MVSGKPSETLKPLPVGDSDWANFSQKSYTVDKTLLIRELVDDGTKVALFTRPRRFGKTTALSMLRTFFEKTPHDTSGLFKRFKIWSAGEKYRREQGRYPVIYLTFKDVSGMTFEESFGKIRMVVASAIAEHKQAIDSLAKDEDRARLRRVLDEKGDTQDVGASLGLIAQAVHVYHAQTADAQGDNAEYAKPIILIDEYDAPINNASTSGYVDAMTSFMRTFLSGALKDNGHVAKGIMTGVLRVAKEGILSGLNNLRVWTVFDERYNAYFGFTEDEVASLAAYYGRSDKMPEIKAWYDGYNFGGAEIYNPWSVLNYFDRLCKPGAYWLDTSSNVVIADIVRDLPHDTVGTLEALLRDGHAMVPMTMELGPYVQIHEDADTLYALLVSSGYLTCRSPIENGRCKVAIPNRELAHVFMDDIVRKINRGVKTGSYGAIADALTDRSPESFREAIQQFLTESVSYFDSASEGFFHGLTLGFLAVLRDRYKVRSNRESGEGRFDIALMPRLAGFPGVIIEVKAASSEADDLQKLALEARAQIDAKGYAAEMSAEGVEDILKFGLAYCKKRVFLVERLSSDFVQSH